MRFVARLLRPLMKKLLFKICISFLFCASTLLSQELTVTPVTLLNSSLFSQAPYELGISNDEALDVLGRALEDSDFRAAIAILETNIAPNKSNTKDREKFKENLNDVLSYLNGANKKSSSDIALMASFLGIYLDGLYFSPFSKKSRPYTESFLVTYQKNNICVGYTQQAQLYSTKKFTGYYDYDYAIDILLKGKSSCLSLVDGDWRKKKYQSDLLLFKARKELIKKINKR